MQRFPNILSFLALLGLFVAPRTAMGQPPGGAQIIGRVRNANGVPQLGALVKVLGTNSSVKGTTYTDLDGRYRIGELAPGRYVVSVAETSLTPAVRRALRLNERSRAIVDLTLGTLSNPVPWLPAELRSAEEPSDDWQWTLRSPTNRPILRFSRDPQVASVSSEELSRRAQGVSRIKVGSNGGFGRAGVEQSFLESYLRRDASVVRIGAGIQEPWAARAGSGSSTHITADILRPMGFTSEGRSLVSIESHPEVTSRPFGPGFQSLRMATAQRTHFGDVALLEVGGSLDLSHSDDFLFITHPFLRLELHPVSKLRVGYGFATSRDVEEFDELSRVEENIPGVVDSQNGMREASELHQQIYLEDGVGSGLLRLTYHRDSPGTVIVTGATSSRDPLPAAKDMLIAIVGLEGIMVDSTSGTFRTMATVSGSQGWGVEVSGPLRPTLWLGISYSAGQALVLQPSSSVSPGAKRIVQVKSDAITFAMKGRMVQTGTELRATYRWQPAQTITAVSPFAIFGDQPYLSFHLRQPLRCHGLFPSGIKMTADVTNLLAEGYRPASTNNAQIVFLAQSPRATAAGLAIDF